MDGSSARRWSLRSKVSFRLAVARRTCSCDMSEYVFLCGYKIENGSEQRYSGSKFGWFLTSDNGVSTSQKGRSTCSEMGSLWMAVRTNGRRHGVIGYGSVETCCLNSVKWLCNFPSVATDDDNKQTS